MLGRDALFSGRHKTIPGVKTFAVQASDTLEKSDPSPLDYGIPSIREI